MKPNILVYEEKPKDFQAQVEVAAIYVAVGGKILLLERSHHKEETGAWGVPGGENGSWRNAARSCKTGTIRGDRNQGSFRHLPTPLRPPLHAQAHHRLRLPPIRAPFG